MYTQVLFNFFTKVYTELFLIVCRGTGQFNEVMWSLEMSSAVISCSTTNRSTGNHRASKPEAQGCTAEQTAGVLVGVMMQNGCWMITTPLTDFSCKGKLAAEASTSDPNDITPHRSSGLIWWMQLRINSSKSCFETGRTLLILVICFHVGTIFCRSPWGCDGKVQNGSRPSSSSPSSSLHILHSGGWLQI